MMNNRTMLTIPARILTSTLTPTTRSRGVVGASMGMGTGMYEYRVFLSSAVSSKSNNTNTIDTNMVRLSKRMSELNLCSRRQADRLILASSVLLQGQVVPPILGQKVPADTTDIVIQTTTATTAADHGDKNGNGDENGDNQNDHDKKRNKTQEDPLGNPGDTIVLHKPIDYVSGQPDPRHGHIPAVRLLTRSNIYTPTKELQDVLSNGNYLHFAKKFPKRRRGARRDRNLNGGNGWENTSAYSSSERNDTNSERISTLVNYAPAGRLDLDSSGLLLFTKNGVIAKNVLNSKRTDADADGVADQDKDDLLSSSSSSSSSPSSSSSNLITKEYYVKVEPVQSLTRDERRMGMDERRIPLRPVWDLSSLLGKRGNSGRDDQGRMTRIRRRLWNESTNLRPLLEAEWMEEGKDKQGAWDGTGTIRMVLQEGRKRQIRRMCRELLGLHVVELKRTRIGGVSLGDLPPGRWRPLTKVERESLLYPSGSTHGRTSETEPLARKDDTSDTTSDDTLHTSKPRSPPKHALAALEVFSR